MAEITAQNRPKRRSVWYAPLALIMLFIVAALIMSLFFRVSVIRVVNASEYSDAEIIAASGIEEGDNLFFVDRFSAASLIFADLPYMETVSIRRELPGKIIIQAEGTAAAAYMVLDDEYWLIDRKGQMLGTVGATDAEAFPEVRNLTPISPIEGEIMLVEGTNVDRLARASALITALRAEDMMEDIRWIDMDDPLNPSLRYQDRLTVYLGAAEDAAYQTALLKNVLAKLAEDDTGTLYYAGGSAWTFSPN